ncbi:cytochrome p450 domain-containing protein [Apiospora phragmitis]|uniref:Cytochrome p450 domain-containing protein n=1 Tax=Apiospora phragmitis TaxID=2905665 RepID=A0ABR1UL96_9PEZI
MSLPIPQPPGIPILGNIFDVDSSNTWASLKKLSEKYGEIFQIKVLGHPIVFVAGAALAEELCDEKRFRKYVGGPIVEIRQAVHDALFTAFDHEESWGIAHRIIAPNLSPTSIAERFPEMSETTDELIAKWHNLGANNNVVSVLSELNRLNLEATTLTLFGKKLGCLTGKEHPMIQAMDVSTGEAMRRPTRPWLLNWLIYGRTFQRGIDTMRAYGDALVKHRKMNPTDRQDLLAAMMNAKDPQTGKQLTSSQVVDEIVSMPIGSSTAPALLSTAVYFLVNNPAVIAAARREIDEVVGIGQALKYTYLAHLEYMEGIVRESLRLSFAAPGFNIEPLPRSNTDDKSPVLLAGGKYAIAPSQPVIIVLAGVNRDPTVFSDPLEFKPERMTGQSFAKLPEGVKKWFGNGKRECIGKHYAWLWNMVVLTKLIREVDFEAVDSGYELAQDGHFNLRPVDFQVKVQPRGV